MYFDIMCEFFVYIYLLRFLRLNEVKNDEKGNNQIL